MHRTRSIGLSIWLTSVALIALSSTGCTSDDTVDPPPSENAGTGGGASAATFSAVLGVFTNRGCATCHSGSPSAINGGLQFNPADKQQAYGALVGKTSPGASGSMCGGMAYVTANQPSGSLLYRKLTASPGCGTRMPQGGTPLNDSELATVSSWISGGAKND